MLHGTNKAPSTQAILQIHNKGNMLNETSWQKQAPVYIQNMGDSLACPLNQPLVWQMLLKGTLNGTKAEIFHNVQRFFVFFAKALYLQTGGVAVAIYGA